MLVFYGFLIEFRAHWGASSPANAGWCVGAEYPTATGEGLLAPGSRPWWMAFLEISHDFVQTRSRNTILSDLMWVTLIYSTWFVVISYDHTYTYLNLIWWIYCIGGYPTKELSSSVGNPHVSRGGPGLAAHPQWILRSRTGVLWSGSRVAVSVPQIYKLNAKIKLSRRSVLRFGSIWWEGIILINVYLALNEWTLINWGIQKSDQGVSETGIPPIINQGFINPVQNWGETWRETLHWWMKSSF